MSSILKMIMDVSLFEYVFARNDTYGGSDGGSGPTRIFNRCLLNTGMDGNKLEGFLTYFIILFCYVCPEATSHFIIWSACSVVGKATCV